MRFNPVVVERISDRKIIMQQVWRYSKIPIVCIYVRIYIIYICVAKNSLLSIVGLKINCTVARAMS